ncbi:hypothetical protein [Escherichia coli]|uniref:hypothetical protein n=1 Tax=Escherichia coli TaxID=562 RepID=UPI00257806FB|nr:hypothetical protein [Escherichia coli]MDM1243047.1 hypothetical protein [Escherichia coli]
MPLWLGWNWRDGNFGGSGLQPQYAFDSVEFARIGGDFTVDKRAMQEYRLQLNALNVGKFPFSKLPQTEWQTERYGWDAW